MACMHVHYNCQFIIIIVQPQPLTAYQEDRNHLIAQVFRLLALLVSFGYYDDDEDVKELLPKVISCLDGRKDIIEPQSKRKSEKSMSSSNANNSYILMQH